MKKLFTKTTAIVSVITLVAMLFVGFYATKQTSASETPVALQKWSFLQGGHIKGEGATDAGYLNSVKVSDSETITGWQRSVDAEQRQNASAVSDGFVMDIENNGWDADWANNYANPWSIQANMYDVSALDGHVYIVKFKAKASKRKNAYIGFSTRTEGLRPQGEDLIYGPDDLPTSQTIAITTAEQEFYFRFTNWAAVEKFNVDIMLGAFTFQKDYAGNDTSSIVIDTEPQKCWPGDDKPGTVTISNFQIIDAGKNEDYTTKEPVFTTQAPETTKAPTPKPTTKPTVKKLDKVTKVKVKSVKKKKIKISWKKVKYAQKYEIKVNSKTYKTSKASKVIKNKKFKKGKKVKVKVRAIAKGYTSGPWSKTVKKKITK